MFRSRVVFAGKTKWFDSLNSHTESLATLSRLPSSLDPVGSLSNCHVDSDPVQCPMYKNQEPDQGSLGDLPQIQTRIDIKKVHAQTSSTAFRRHSFSDYLLRSANMGSEQRTRKNDSIDTTQDAMTHYPDEKEIQKDWETRYRAQRREWKSWHHRNV